MPFVLSSGLHLKVFLHSNKNEFSLKDRMCQQSLVVVKLLSHV